MAFSTADYSDWTLRGEGGEAEIFRARQVSLDRLVAIKRLKLSTIGNDEDIRRFEREAKLCASLIHPSLVPIFDYGSEGKFYYLVMEFVQGVDLGKIADLPKEVQLGNTEVTVTRVRPPRAQLPETLKVHLARQMVEVVEYIHQKGVHHRDLKPENFMADASAHVKLLDLGMARALFHSHTDALGTALKGTLAYLPPETLRGQGQPGQASEYYALALVILELFLGRRFYKGKNSEETLALIQTGIPLLEMDIVPVAVRQLLKPYLDLDPLRRPKSLDPMLKGFKAMQGNTLAIAGGREALQTVIQKEQRTWLWAMVSASESTGKVDDAFARLRELLEADPEDPVAQAKFQELGMRLNDEIESSLTDTRQSSQPDLNIRPAEGQTSYSRSWSGIVGSPSRKKFATLALMSAAVLVAAWVYTQRSRPQPSELSRDLAERELKLLSQEDEASAQAPPPQSRKPGLRPYGVLIMTGLPKDFRVLVNRVQYPTSGEIHLPAGKHLLEIQDPRSRPIWRDSVSVEGGEPTVYDFPRRAGKP